MRFDNRGPRVAAARRSAFRPKAEGLEDRLLLSGFTFDEGGSAPPSLPNIASTGGGGPFGVQMAGGIQPGGAGYAVSDVGDANADGYDDFLISSPSVVSNGGQIGLGNGANAKVYLVYGSRSVNAGNIDWLTLDATNQRVGDLTQLGNAPANQQNPITGNNGFPYAGITFVTNSEPNSALGASVAPVTINNTPAFLIGAPGGNDANNANPGTGRAYLIFGGAGLNGLASPTTIDLDNPGTGGVNFITFVTGGTGSTIGLANAGMSVSGPGDIFTDLTNDVAIGAPSANINGLTGAGAVYLVDGKSISVGTSTINLSLMNQSGGPTGVVFAGANSGDQAGWSTAGAGSVNFQLTSSNEKVPDLLIGAPGGAKAYLVNGGSSLLTAPLSGNISLSRIGDARTTNPPNPNIPPPAGTVPGATFTGTPGDGTGYAVSTAGDFNNDGINDILIGSPFSNQNTGLVTMFYGANFTTTSTNSLVGPINLNPIPSNVAYTQFVGGAINNLAGFSLTQLGTIGSNPANPIAIGVPGMTVGASPNAGGVFIIPGRTGGQPKGPFALTTAGVVSSPISATQLVYSNGGSLFFGSSVSGKLTASTQTKTADNDLLADLIVGASGYSAISGRTLAGSAMITEGGLIQLATPTFAGLSPVISVDQKPLASGGPYPVSATTPNTVKIWVDSIAGPNPFTPFTDIDLNTISVNGVSFTPPNVTIAQIPDENGDGIPDAILTIQPRSALQLTTATTTFTLNGTTLPNTPNPSEEFSSTVPITVSGGGGGGGGAVASATPIGLVRPTDFVPHFGPDQFTPSTLQLSIFDYKAIPLRRAIQQFLPPKPFRERMLNFFFPKNYHFQPARTGTGFTLGQHTFDTSRIHGLKPVVFTHRQLVVPTNRQTERIWP